MGLTITASAKYLNKPLLLQGLIFYLIYSLKKLQKINHIFLMKLILYLIKLIFFISLIINIDWRAFPLVL